MLSRNFHKSIVECLPSMRDVSVLDDGEDQIVNVTVLFAVSMTAVLYDVRV